MDYNYYLISLGFIPLFASRGALPVFVSAIVSSQASDWEWLADEAGIDLIVGLPEWLSSPLALFILALLVIVENVFQRSPELRRVMAIGESQLKGIFAFFLCYFMVGGQLQGLEKHIDNVGLHTDFAGLLSVEYVWAYGVGLMTWFLARLRRGVYDMFAELDPEDDMGVQKLLLYMETTLGICGPIIFIVFPAAAAVLAGISIFALKRCQKHFDDVEAANRIPCANCNNDIHLCSLYCGDCGHANPSPRQVGLLGQAKTGIAHDLVTHRYRMLERKRCPHCGERSSSNAVDVVCERCRRAFFSSYEVGRQYLAYLSGKLPKVLLICAICSLIPVVGVIPGVIYYRLNLVSGLKAYLPVSVSFLGRWILRVLCLLLLFWQVVPMLGVLSIPLMCLLNYLLFGGALRHSINAIPTTPATQTQPISPPHTSMEPSTNPDPRG